MSKIDREVRPTVAVNAIIFNEDREVLLTQRRDNGKWCLPGGMLEIRESVKDATVRELKEEIGLVVEVLRLTGIYSDPNLKIIPPAKEFLVVLAFECVIKGGRPTLSKEVQDWGYFPLRSLPDTISTHRERMQDARDLGEPRLK